MRDFTVSDRHILIERDEADTGNGIWHPETTGEVKTGIVVQSRSSVVRVDDHVMFHAKAGQAIRLNDKAYLLLHETDIPALLC